MRDRSNSAKRTRAGRNPPRKSGRYKFPLRRQYAATVSLNMSEYSKSIDTPLGPVGVTWKDGILIRVDLEPKGLEESAVPLPMLIADQLDAYFSDGSKGFDLPIELRGTPFQHRVWTLLRSIPPGRTLTYGALARKLGTSPRAIGGACRANQCPIVVPCHRVVAAKGLGGFSGATAGRKLEVKRWLLRHETSMEFSARSKVT